VDGGIFDDRGSTLLIDAANRGDAEIVQALLASGTRESWATNRGVPSPCPDAILLLRSGR